MRDFSNDPSYEDTFWDEDHGTGRWAGSCGSHYGTDEWTYRIEFEDGYYDDYFLSQLKRIYDSRIRLRDLVDIRRENGIRLRGTVVEIKKDEKQPYCVSGHGALVWMAAHEFERFVRADAPERAYKTLTAVRARIDVLEAELTALKLTEEVLEGVYV